MAKFNIARDGAPKRLTDPAVHPGMYHVTENPDGSKIPSWLSRPLAEMATKGHVGLQGKHAGAPIYFRNVKIKALD